MSQYQVDETTVSEFDSNLAAVSAFDSSLIYLVL